MNGWAILSVSRRDTATQDNQNTGKLEAQATGQSEPGASATGLMQPAIPGTPLARLQDERTQMPRRRRFELPGSCGTLPVNGSQTKVASRAAPARCETLFVAGHPQHQNGQPLLPLRLSRQPPAPRCHTHARPYYVRHPRMESFEWRKRNCLRTSGLINDGCSFSRAFLNGLALSRSGAILVTRRERRKRSTSVYSKSPTNWKRRVASKWSGRS